VIGVLGGIGTHPFANHTEVGAQPSFWKHLIKDLTVSAMEGLSEELRGETRTGDSTGARASGESQQTRASPGPLFWMPIRHA
jgi:hypothetical protein